MTKGERLRRHLPHALLAAVAVGVVVRLTLRDGVDLLAPAVHGSPPAVLAGVAALAGALLYAERRRVTAAAALTVAVALLLWHVAAMQLVAIRPPGPPGCAQVAVWNARHGKHGFRAVEDELVDLDADVVALVEGGGDHDVRRAAWAAAFPDHEAFYGKSGLILLVRGDIVEAYAERLDGGGRALVANLVVGKQRFRIVVVDVKTDWFEPRGPVFAALERLLRRQGDGPLLVVGDFNTPHDSVHFDAWRDELGLSNAFEVAGSGGRATWPDPFPLLQLDHAWVNDGLAVYDVEHSDVASSDHLPVVFQVALR